jgi:D-glycero-alpha-D-manno-heptose-7-phosphate kinase
MIITRAPLRITFGGGGTDLPSYYSKFGGQLVAGGIDKYIYIALHKIFPNEFIVKYSQIERVGSADEIKHPIIREVLKSHKVTPRLEIASHADIPDGTGLGSSGSFTVALLKAISFYERQHILTEALAEEACDIEINRLGEPVGKQDQYAAAFGGLTCFTFNKDGSVEVEPLRVSGETIHDLEDNLLLFFTGYTRRASGVLEEQKNKSDALDQEMINNLHFTKELGQSSKKALEAGDLKEFSHLMNVHWENKKKRSSNMSKSDIDNAYSVAIENGALGGKLIGAGAGGFLMFYAREQALLRKAMAKLNLEEVRFKFDFEGAKVVST